MSEIHGYSSFFGTFSLIPGRYWYEKRPIGPAAVASPLHPQKVVKKAVAAMSYFATLPPGDAPKRVAVLGFDRVAGLDVVIALETLTRARMDYDNRRNVSCYEVILVGVEKKNFVSESGLGFKARKMIQTAPPFDTIIVPGGSGLRESGTLQTVAKWLAERATSTKRIASISTGIYGLAESGLLNGRHVTTHWRFGREVAHRFPSLRVDMGASFLQDGIFHTSGGGAASMEMLLAMIAEDYGANTALALAREFGVGLRAPGDEADYIEPNDVQPGSTERLAELPAWITAHLHENLSVQAIAQRAGLSARHFTRVFKLVFNNSPADFVKQMRLNEARRRLLMPRNNIESVAAAVGFKSPEAFRRAFENRLGITPSGFRNRYQTRASLLFGVPGGSRTAVTQRTKLRAD